MKSFGIITANIFFVAAAFADGPQDNVADKVRPVPPPGIKVPAALRDELLKDVAALRTEVDNLRIALAKNPALLALLPDVEIFSNAVYYALKYDEVYSEKELVSARGLLAKGRERAKDLREGKAPWNTQTGPVVRGYQSKIDGSIQPYGIIVPATFKNDGVPRRLDLWWHGRGEKLTELSFLLGRQADKNQFVANGFVLHPYGRYCNANHFAGEIDTFEAIAHARKYYPIDENRIVARGYSMGGAACWGYAVHYPGLWAAAQPGAGFSETPEFLRVFQGETIKPNEWQKKLLHWYDCTDWAGNLYNLPTVAFSNEKEKQRQAADIMAEAMLRENLQLTHILAPGDLHKYPPPPEQKADLFGRIDSIVDKGRDPLPKSLRFTTYTLRYNTLRWLTIDSLEQHWEQARVTAEIVDDFGAKRDVVVHTKNVSGFTLSIPPGHSPFPNRNRPITVVIDGQKIAAATAQSDRSWRSEFRKADGKWGLYLVPTVNDGDLRKRHGLQGPIDDAFMDKFVMVRPTGKTPNEKVATWIAGEMNHAVDHWRKQFRGELQPVDDINVTDAMIANSNLVLWGDPKSNSVLAKIADKLPITWLVGNKDKGVVRYGQRVYDVDHHVPVLIYPNPLNPKKYVVLNSGFTFREYDYLNNARQIPRLPDWAILDINQPRTSQRPAGIADAGFFDERWQLPAKN